MTPVRRLASTPPGLSATVSAVGGIATYTNLIPSSTGTHTLTATAEGLTSTTSKPFNVVASAYPISGHVRYDDGSPVAGASIRIDGTTYQTDTAGNHASKPLPAGGAYTVQFLYRGVSPWCLHTQGRRLHPQSRPQPDGRFHGHPPQVGLTGRVTTAGQPLSGVTISADLAGYTFDGPFTFDNLKSVPTINFVAR